jgi:hypothetical protein
MCAVPSAEYVDFLSKVTPRNVAEYKTQMDRFNLGLPGEADCPVFDGVFKYCQVRSLLHPCALRSSVARGGNVAALVTLS